MNPVTPDFWLGIFCGAAIAYIAGIIGDWLFEHGGEITILIDKSVRRNKIEQRGNDKENK